MTDWTRAQVLAGDGEVHARWTAPPETPWAPQRTRWLSAPNLAHLERAAAAAGLPWPGSPPAPRSGWGALGDR